MAVNMEESFQALYDAFVAQQQKLAEIAENLSKIESIGGGGGDGNATIEDYESGKLYKRNTLIVDPNTETVYRVLVEYTSNTVESDYANGLIKLVGFESSIVTFPHDPSQAEINTLPKDTIVAVYNSNDTPYIPDT